MSIPNNAAPSSRLAPPASPSTLGYRFLAGKLRLDGELPADLGGLPVADPAENGFFLAGTTEIHCDAEGVHTTEISCLPPHGNTEIRCDAEAVHTTEISCLPPHGNTEIRCDAEAVHTTEISCGGHAGTTEISCP